ncbi:MAG: hypothetical protein HFH54_09845 [Lachnospiraceae bacterium]|nr:hypothetical protein [Lachnospiraceae bacterium]
MRINPTEKTNVRYRFLAEDQCKTMFDSILQVLSCTGCVVDSAEARQLMTEAGCHVDGERVYIPALHFMGHWLRTGIRYRPEPCRCGGNE